MFNFVAITAFSVKISTLWLVIKGEISPLFVELRHVSVASGAALALLCTVQADGPIVTSWCSRCFSLSAVWRHANFVLQHRSVLFS